MGENHPGLGRMNSDCAALRRAHQTCDALSPKRPTKVSDQPTRCGNCGDMSNSRAEIQGEVRLSLVFQRGKRSVVEHSCRQGKIDGPREQGTVQRGSRPADAALV